MTTGYVLFQLAERTFATPLDDVREIVRLETIERLPGTRPPLAGVVVLRGAPLPVLDVRGITAGAGPDDAAERGDILVMEMPEETVGVAVDRVVAVLHPDELPESDSVPRSLPSYVVGVHRHGDAPVLLVDLPRLLDNVAEGWLAALAPEPVA